MAKNKAAEQTTMLPLDDTPKVRPLTEGMTRKGGRNLTTQVARRPQPPAAVRAKAEISPTSVLKILADAAADPNVNPDKMRALLDLQKEISAKEARDAFTRSYIAMQRELPSIDAKGRIVIPAKEGSRNRQAQNTPYATFNEIHRVTTPILEKHGFALGFAPDSTEDSRLIMRGYLEHVSGHQKTGNIVLPMDTTGSKNNVQAIGSAISYGKRYLAVTLLNLVSHAAQDADDDGVAAGQKVEPEKTEELKPKITKAQVAELHKLIEDSGATEGMVLNHFKVEALEEMTPADFIEAKQACNNFKAKRAAGNGAPRNQD